MGLPATFTSDPGGVNPRSFPAATSPARNRRSATDCPSAFRSTRRQDAGQRVP